MSNLNLPPGWSAQTDLKKYSTLSATEGQTANQSRTKPEKLYWVPRGESVSIHKRKIPGMVYIGLSPRKNDHSSEEKCRAYIDPTLPVTQPMPKHDWHTTPYPLLRYSTIPPERRAGYLDWLSSGAKDGSSCLDYVLLYFFGLERRFFLDQSSPEEMHEIFEEVSRLAALFTKKSDYYLYRMDNFLTYASAVLKNVDNIQPIFENPEWGLPFLVRFAIGTHIANDTRLNADWLLSWFLCDPEINFRTPGQRCYKEFMELFRIRFNEQFPKGLKVRKSRYQLDDHYDAGSGEFTVIIRPIANGNPVPDIAMNYKTLEVAQQVADRAMDDLGKLSRYLGRNPNGRGSIKAHRLLPPELRPLFKPDQFDQVRVWAKNVLERGELIPISDVALRLEGKKPVKFSKGELIDLDESLAYLGFGIAPDLRSIVTSPKIDDPVVLFDLGGPVEQPEKVSTTYKVALAELALTSFVAHADGPITELEQKRLFDQIHSITGLSDYEQRRLQAHLTWFQAVPPGIFLLRRVLNEADAKQHSRIRTTVVAAAHADDIVKPEKIVAIQKIYRTMYLDPDLVYSEIHAGKVLDAPVRVRAAQPGKPGEVIPNEKPKNLDAKRIATIQQDTERVSATLANIFSTEEVEKIVASEPSSTLAGLDEKHYALVREIITREHWSNDEFINLSMRHGLMAAGALETINEWSFGIYDEALIEEYEGYDISPDVADALAENFEKEKN